GDQVVEAPLADGRLLDGHEATGAGDGAMKMAMLTLMASLAAASLGDGGTQPVLIEYKAVTKAADGNERTLALALRVKGELRLWTFTAPADVRGVKLLCTGSAAYVYLPAFGKVRRVATDALDQPFFGLAYSAAELCSFA